MTTKQGLAFSVGIINGTMIIMESLLDSQEFEEYCDNAQSMIAQIEKQLKIIQDE